MSDNKVCRLAKRIVGPVVPEAFAISNEPHAQLQDGQFRIAAEYISLDPAMRGWMNDGKSYVPPVALGDVMRGFSAGRVIESRNDKFAVGDPAIGLLGVQTHPVSDGRGIIKPKLDLAPLPSWLGGLGMPGQTAYFGLLKVASVKSGETVVVSAASGAVGHIVGQIAKIKGARAVGIAGGAEKCATLIDDYGFDAAVDYKAGDLSGQLKAACPDGIDVNFENVGGEIFDTVLSQMNPFGRIAICGLISAYTATSLPPGPQNIRFILTMRLKVQGFIVFDFANEIPEAMQALGEWHRDGQLKFHEDIRKGSINSFAETLNLLYTGGNKGKLILQL